jgi:hypothetical protein
MGVVCTALDALVGSFSFEQRYVYEAVRKGWNMAIIGRAGTGKSYVLGGMKTTFMAADIDRRLFTSMSGVSAVGIGGQTFHGATGFPVVREEFVRENGAVKTRAFMKEKICGTEGVGSMAAAERLAWRDNASKRMLMLHDMVSMAVDEASMQPSGMMDIAEQGIRDLRGGTAVFGGATMVYCMDPCQTGPIARGTLAYRHNVVWRSSCWVDTFRRRRVGVADADGDYETEDYPGEIMFQTNYRQAGDPGFQRLLDKMRYGFDPAGNDDERLGPRDVAQLQAKCRADLAGRGNGGREMSVQQIAEMLLEVDGVFIGSLNKEVNAVNEGVHQLLMKRARDQRWAHGEGYVQSKGVRVAHGRVLPALAEDDLEMVVGGIVMYNVNVDVREGLANGRRGRIVHFEHDELASREWGAMIQGMILDTTPKKGGNADEDDDEEFDAYARRKAPGGGGMGAEVAAPGASSGVMVYAAVVDLFGRGSEPLQRVRILPQVTHAREGYLRQPGELVLRYPVKRGAAMTIHSTQSMTITCKGLISQARCFDKAMAYTLFSRFPSLDDIFLLDFDASKIIVDEEAVAYCRMIERRMADMEPQMRKLIADVDSVHADVKAEYARHQGGDVVGRATLRGLELRAARDGYDEDVRMVTEMMGERDAWDACADIADEVEIEGKHMASLGYGYKDAEGNVWESEAARQEMLDAMV